MQDDIKETLDRQNKPKQKQELNKRVLHPLFKIVSKDLETYPSQKHRRIHRFFLNIK